MQRAEATPLNRISGLVPFCALFEDHLAVKNAPLEKWILATSSPRTDLKEQFYCCPVGLCLAATCKEGTSEKRVLAKGHWPKQDVADASSECWTLSHRFLELLDYNTLL